MYDKNCRYTWYRNATKKLDELQGLDLTQAEWRKDMRQQFNHHWFR